MALKLKPGEIVRHSYAPNKKMVFLSYRKDMRGYCWVMDLQQNYDAAPQLGSATKSAAFHSSTSACLFRKNVKEAKDRPDLERA